MGRESIRSSLTALSPWGAWGSICCFRVSVLEMRTQCHYLVTSLPFSTGRFWSWRDFPYVRVQLSPVHAVLQHVPVPSAQSQLPWWLITAKSHYLHVSETLPRSIPALANCSFAGWFERGLSLSKYSFRCSRDGADPES